MLIWVQVCLKSEPRFSMTWQNYPSELDFAQASLVRENASFSQMGLFSSDISDFEHFSRRSSSASSVWSLEIRRDRILSFNFLPSSYWKRTRSLHFGRKNQFHGYNQPMFKIWCSWSKMGCFSLFKLPKKYVWCDQKLKISLCIRWY